VLRNRLRSYLEMAHFDREGNIVAPIADEGIAETQNGVGVIVIDDSESDSIMSPEMDLEV